MMLKCPPFGTRQSAPHMGVPVHCKKTFSKYMQSVLEQAQATEKAWRILRRAEGATKNIFLNKLEVLLRTHADVVLAANKKDLAENPALSSSMRRRLLLSESSMTAIADGVRAIAELPDPVGEVIE